MSRNHRKHPRRYVDENGYERGRLEHSDLIHRQKAYYELYLSNRDKYPLPFGNYQVHHIDGNKRNNDISNLQIVTQEEHEIIHGLSGSQRGQAKNFETDNKSDEKHFDSNSARRPSKSSFSFKIYLFLRIVVFLLSVTLIYKIDKSKVANLPNCDNYCRNNFLKEHQNFLNSNVLDKHTCLCEGERTILIAVDNTGKEYGSVLQFNDFRTGKQSDMCPCFQIKNNLDEKVVAKVYSVSIDSRGTKYGHESEITILANEKQLIYDLKCRAGQIVNSICAIDSESISYEIIEPFHLESKKINVTSIIYLNIT